MANRGKRLDQQTQERIFVMKRKSLGIKTIARRLGISRNTARKYFKMSVAV